MHGPGIVRVVTHADDGHVTGMDLVYKIEGVGSPSGAPKKTVGYLAHNRLFVPVPLPS